MAAIIILQRESRKYSRKSSNFQGKELLRTQVNYILYRKRERDLKNNGSLKYWLQFKGREEDISCVILQRNLPLEWVPVSRACARDEQKLKSGWMIKGEKNNLNIKMLLWVSYYKRTLKRSDDFLCRLRLGGVTQSRGL